MYYNNILMKIRKIYSRDRWNQKTSNYTQLNMSKTNIIMKNQNYEYLKWPKQSRNTNDKNWSKYFSLSSFKRKFNKKLCSSKIRNWTFNSTWTSESLLTRSMCKSSISK